MSVGIPPEILRLTTHAFPPRLDAPMGSAERRSPICGSRVIVDVDIGPDGEVVSFGMKVNACAFGQAASAVMARGLAGRSVEELAATKAALADWMADKGSMPDWPDIDIIRPERLNSVRKASVQLAFEAAADAAADARDRGQRLAAE